MLLALTLAMAAPTWTLVLGGDIMLNGISPKSDPFKGISRVLQDADLAIANLEIPLTAATRPTSRKSKEELKAKSQFILKADPRHGAWLKASGLDLVSLGNNHMSDYGGKGIAESRGILDDAGIGYAGAGKNWAEARAAATFTLPDGQRVALISYLAFLTDKALRKCGPATGKQAGIAVLPLGGAIGKRAKAALQAAVTRAREDGEFVIVALHWGIEREPVPTHYQVALGRAFVDAGVDVVWGHHPHVLQGSEVYKGKPILYSTGNLVSSRPATTALYRLTFEGLRFKSAEILPAKISKGAVTLLEGKVATTALAAARSWDKRLRERYPSKSSKRIAG